MYYYGLHFVGSDKVPVQVRVHTPKTEIWARSALVDRVLTEC